MIMKVRKFIFVYAIILIITFASQSFATEAVTDNEIGTSSGSSNNMMERIENLLYGYIVKGGLIERLGKAESDLFGRSLPGTIAERYTAIVNFLENGTEDQPSMIFKLGVAEWIINKKIAGSNSVMSRLENLENNLNGSTSQGNPVAMRIESLLSTLVSDPVSFKNVILPGDTVLKFRFLDEMNPAKSQVGDVVRLELTNDIIIDDCLIAPAGSILLTEVRAVKRPRAFGIPGEVRLSFGDFVPLGPQKPKIKIDKASQAAIKEARKLGDRGEGAVVSAGAASIAGAALLGPVGLVSGLFIRGNSIKVTPGSVTFVQTDGETIISAYPIPASLQNNIPYAEPDEEKNSGASASVSASSSSSKRRTKKASETKKSRSVKKSANNNNSSNNNDDDDDDEDFELPPEQNVN